MLAEILEYETKRLKRLNARKPGDARYREIYKDRVHASKERYRLANLEKVKAAKRKWRLNNPEKMQACREKWISTGDNKEKRRSSINAWQQKNREKVREDTRKWRELNKDKMRALIAAWGGRNPDKLRAYVRRRQAAKIQAVPAWADTEAIIRIYKKAVQMRAHVDHIVPLRSKVVCGLHVANNLQLLTASENAAKGNRHWPDMP
jgi:hypothetical protein